MTTVKPLTVCIKTKLWKILKEMGMPDHLTCLLRNLYAGQEATVKMGLGTTDWFKMGKWVCQGYILSPCLFNLDAEYIMWNGGLDEAQAGIKITGRNINNLRNTDGTTLMAEREEALKNLLMRVKEGSEKASLKLNIKKKKLRSWHPTPLFHGKQKGEMWKQWQIPSSWALKSLRMVTAAMKSEDDSFLAGKLWQT